MRYLQVVTSIIAFFLLHLTVNADTPTKNKIVDPVKWSVEVQPKDATSGKIVWTAEIQPGYHIYGMQKVADDGPVPTSITVPEISGISFDGAITPTRPASKINDKLFSLVLYEWSETVSFTLNYALDADCPGVSFTSEISYMACTAKSCLRPVEQLPLVVTIGSPDSNATTRTNGDTLVNTTLENTVAADDNMQHNNMLWEPVSDTDANNTQSNNNATIYTLLLMGFLGGLLALLTPCVWPMIPMTVSFFLKKSKSRIKSIVDASIYGISIIVIFLILGIAVTMLFGAGTLNEIATSALFNLLFFAMLVVFAVSFFGAFDITLPSKWSNAADNKAGTSAGITSIFFMAFTLVLVSFSCTGPIIGTLLVEAASDGSIIGPAFGMGGFALGLALPFTLFAYFPSLLKSMPKAGGWMNSVKVVLGFIELILSLKFLSVADLAYGWRILDREVFLSLWIVLFVLLGMYLLGKLRFSHDSESKHTSVFGFFMAVASFAFAIYLVPGLWGAPLKAVSAFAPPLTTQDFNLYGGELREFHDYDEGMAYASENNLPVMLDFSGHACVNCRKMEGTVFDNTTVKSMLNNDYVVIKLMVDEKAKLTHPYFVEENGRKVEIKTVGDKWSYLQRHKFGINSQPYYVLLNDEGKLLAPSRAYDENIPAFVDWLNTGLKNFQK